MDDVESGWLDTPFHYKIDQHILNRNNRVFSMLIDGAKVYVKKRDRSKKHIGHHLQEALYKVTKNPMLTPTVLGREENDVLFQVEKLRLLRAQGFNVPEVLHVEEEYFVMRDLGENLIDFLKRTPQQADTYLRKACEEIARLHEKDFVHGGSQVKNFVTRNGRIGLIDFEERVHPQDVEGFKVRDIMVFLMSLERCGFDPDVRKLCSAYERYVAKDVYGILKRFFHTCRWVGFLGKPVFQSIGMSDVRAFLGIMEKFDA